MAASSTEERIALARSAWEAYDAGDIEGVLRVVDADVEIYVPVELGNAGTFRGHDGFLSWLAAWNEAWESFELRIIDMVPVGDRHVVSHMQQTGIGRGSGIEVSQEMAWLFEVEDGLAVYISLLTEFDAALAAAREREELEGDGGA